MTWDAFHFFLDPLLRDGSVDCPSPKIWRQVYSQRKSSDTRMVKGPWMKWGADTHSAYYTSCQMWTEGYDWRLLMPNQRQSKVGLVSGGWCQSKNQSFAYNYYIKHMSSTLCERPHLSGMKRHRYTFARDGNQVIPHSIVVKNPQSFQFHSISCMIEPNIQIVSFDTFFYDTYPTLKQTTDQLVRYLFPVEQYRLDTIFGSYFHIEIEYEGECDEIKVMYNSQQLLSQSDDIEIIQIQRVQLTFDVSSGPTNLFCSIPLQFNGMTNGYFFAGIRKENLKYICILFYGHIRLAWDEDEIEAFTTQVGNSVWIPLNNRPLHDFSHASDQTIHDNIELQCLFKEPLDITSQRFAIWCNVWNLLVWNEDDRVRLFRDNIRNDVDSKYVLFCHPPPDTMPTQQTIYRQIGDSVVECPVAHTLIAHGDMYNRCSQCEQPFSRRGYVQMVMESDMCAVCGEETWPINATYMNREEP